MCVCIRDFSTEFKQGIAFKSSYFLPLTDIIGIMERAEVKGKHKCKE